MNQVTIKSYITSHSVVEALKKKGIESEELNAYIASAIRTISSDPNLSKCSHESIYNCLAACVELKLNPSQTEGYVYFVPYGNTCTFMIGARGMRSLMLKHNNVTQLSVNIVREGDEIEYWEDSIYGIHYKYKPQIFSGNNDREILGVVAFIKRTVDGVDYKHLVRMSKSEVDKIKSKAKSQKFWNEHYEEMVKKTALRRLYKECPFSSSSNPVSKAEELEDSFDSNEPIVEKSINSNASVKEESTLNLADALKLVKV